MCLFIKREIKTSSCNSLRPDTRVLYTLVVAAVVGLFLLLASYLHNESRCRYKGWRALSSGASTHSQSVGAIVKVYEWPKNYPTEKGKQKELLGSHQDTTRLRFGHSNEFQRVKAETSKEKGKFAATSGDWNTSLGKVSGYFA